MASDSLLVQLSSLDEKRFGVRTARAPLVTLDTLPSVVEFCRIKGVALLIARCRTHDLPVAQAMEAHGFSLMGTLLHYVLDLSRAPIPVEEGRTRVRPLRSGEEESVREIAAASFRSYCGHYHADPRLDQGLCDEVYASWAYNSCRFRDATHDVLVAEQEGRLVGFAAMRSNSLEEAEGVLFGVHPEAQRASVGRSLMIHGIRWCCSAGARRMLYSTQIDNLAVQKVVVRLGFELGQSYYIFHRWFD